MQVYSLRHGWLQLSHHGKDCDYEMLPSSLVSWGRDIDVTLILGIRM